MRLTRRKLLSSIAMLGAAAALPSFARAQETDSIFDVFARNRVLRDADRTGNTAAAMAAVETPEPILSLDTSYNFQTAIMQYEQIVAQGGWEPMSKAAFNLVLGNSRNAVISIKRRLIASGDMAPQKSLNELFDEATDAGVRRFQARHGLLITGKIDEPTLYAMAVPADYRLTQLKLNALRVQTLSAAVTSDRYVVVNIPAAMIEAVEGGMVVQRHTAIVGRVDRATPIMSSKVHQIKFNPYWTVPKSIIEKDLIKFMNDDPEYLTKYRIRILDGNGTEIPPSAIDWTTNEAVKYTFRQDPGGENSMGHCKIDFYNPYDCYLHDTPQKALFGENARFHSSGCVRVENVDELASWLLRDNGGWDLANVRAAFATNENINVPLTVQVPIHTAYISAWANRQGTISFRSDVYDFDKVGQVNFEG